MKAQDSLNSNKGFIQKTLNKRRNIINDKFALKSYLFISHISESMIRGVCHLIHATIWETVYTEVSE